MDADKTVSPLNFAVAGMLVLLAGAGFAGWMAMGTEMFLSLAETGLAWCL